MLLALISTIDSITSFPLVFRTAITFGSLCTSIPRVASLGGRNRASVYLSPKVKAPKAKVPFSRSTPLEADVNHPQSAAQPRTSGTSLSMSIVGCQVAPLSTSAATPVGCERSHRVLGQFPLKRPTGDDEQAGTPCSHKLRRSHANSCAQFFCMLSHRLSILKTLASTV